jgi:hypothetical protein
MIDPISGQEMTAAEHVMLQQEREIAHPQVQAEYIRRQRQSAGDKKKQKKLPAPPADESDDE